MAKLSEKQIEDLIHEVRSLRADARYDKKWRDYFDDELFKLQGELFSLRKELRKASSGDLDEERLNKASGEVLSTTMTLIDHIIEYGNC